jgi:hypothetical protein
MVITRWTGREVTALRAAMRPRHTQVQFAECIGCSFEAVGKWERLGAAITLRPKYADCMDTQLARLSPHERAIFQAALNTFPPDRPMIADTGQSATQHPVIEVDEDDDMKRRQLILGGATVGVTLLAPPRIDGLPAHIGLGDATELARKVDDYVNREQRVGGGTLALRALTDYSRAKTMLDNCDMDDAAATAFVSAAGNMAVMTGWLFYDSDQHAAAMTSYNNALALAAYAGDDELAAHTCLNMALQGIALSRRFLADPNAEVKSHPRTALRATARAADLARGRPSGRIHALVASRQALAHASLGDRVAFGRSIATAWREMDLAYDGEPLDQCPDWLKFMSHNEVRSHEAIGYSDLGDASKSAELFAEIAAERAGQRNAASYRAWLAASLVQLGDTDTAVTEASVVLDRLASGISSDRTFRKLEPVRQAATKPSFSDFRDRYDQMATQTAQGTLV